jgi:uncharacterized protein (DUF58 family)
MNEYLKYSILWGMTSMIWMIILFALTGSWIILVVLLIVPLMLTVGNLMIFFIEHIEQKRKETKEVKGE